MFDVECFDEIRSLIYDYRYNWFDDEEDGDSIISIFEMVTPDDLYLFHEHGKDIIVPHRQLKGVGVLLRYPQEGECMYCDYFYECCIE